MKPASFDYYAPDGLDEAVSLLAGLGDQGKVLGGGQSLIPVMNMRLAQPGALVDVCRIPELRGIEERDGHTWIGATTRQTAVLHSAQVAGRFPLIGAALGHVGHPANRSRGTFGGTIAHADPAAEMPTVATALDAEMVVAGPAGQRRVAAADFFKGYFTTCIEVDEILIGIEIPWRRGERTAWSFQELARRHGDFAMAGVALVAGLDAGGRVEDARLVLLAVDEVPVRARAAEAALRGRRLDEEGLAAAVGELAVEGLSPTGDFHATAEYRLAITRVLAERAVAEAAGSVAA